MPSLSQRTVSPPPLRRLARVPSPAARHDGRASRAAILQLVRQDPGIHVTEISDRTGLSWHTTAYHLGILERSGMLAVEKVGRDRCVFPKGVPARQRPWLVALRAGQAVDILRVLFDEPRQDVPELARRVGRSEKVVRRRLADLEEAGVLHRVGTWRPVYEVKPSNAKPVAALVRQQARRRPSQRLGKWEWDVRNQRSKVSKGAWRILGVGPQPGRTYEEFVRGYVHPEDRAGLAAVVEKALAEGRSYEHTLRIRTSTGERHIRQRGWVVERDPNGKAVRFAGTVEDVTDQAKGPLPAPAAPPAPDRPAAWQAPATKKRKGRILRRLFAAALKANPRRARGARQA